MVLINSNKDDYSTNEVIDWIALEKEFQVLRDSHDINQKLVLDDDTIVFEINNIDLNAVKSFWYRRGGAYTSSSFINKFNKQLSEQNYINEIKSYVKLDIDRLSQYTHSYFLNSDKITLGNYLKSSINKINTLCLAKEAGLSIPKTIITTRKSDLLATFGTSDFITKPIGEAGVYPVKNEDGEIETYTYTYTSLVDLADLNEDFHVSLFQEKIEKKFEVRTFVLGKELYSMAIFSQGNM
ncbi:MAG: hypothetical protein GQ574_28630 [Crocinitomix sp.]|nr:hypothetical protein [Crocinitomix sp.]